MSCGGNITIYGLFPEDDITQDDLPTEGCDWRVYARPECTVEQCLELSCTYLSLPFGSIFDNGTAATWYFEYELYALTRTLSNQRIHEEDPWDVLNSAWFGLSINSWSSSNPISNAALRCTINNVVFNATSNDSVVDIEDGEWLKFRIERQITTDSLLVTIWNDTRGQGPHAFIPIFSPSMATFTPANDVTLGRNRHDGSACFEGIIRNAKLVVDSVTIGDWPISGTPPIIGATVEDVSGNANNGEVLDIGAGGGITCP